METSTQYDTLIAICIIKSLKGTANVQDMKILQEHVTALIPDEPTVKYLYRLHGRKKA
jgi:hypothetical protein